MVPAPGSANGPAGPARLGPHAVMALLYQYVAGFMHMLHVVPRPHRAPSAHPRAAALHPAPLTGRGCRGTSRCSLRISQYMLDAVSEQMVCLSHDQYCVADVKASGRPRPAAQPAPQLATPASCPN
jgi:hypothetical protein